MNRIIISSNTKVKVVTSDPIFISNNATQVNSDWNANSGVARILNKPDLTVYVNSSSLTTTLSSYVTNSSLTTLLSAYVSNTNLTSTLLNYVTSSSLTSTLSSYALSSSLATVATSGSYNDLSNKPTIPSAQVNSDWNANSGIAQILNKPTLATVATSGSYNDLSSKPDLSIYVNSTSLSTTLSSYVTSSSLTSTLSSYVTSLSLSSTLSSYVLSSSLATVATSGSYNDLSNKPDLSSYATTSSLSSHTSNTSNPHSVTKSQVGLSNVDNTSDADKPISTATQTALNLKATVSQSIANALIFG